MAEKEKKSRGSNSNAAPDEKVMTVSKDASVDMPYKVRSIGKLGAKDGDPYHHEGEEFVVGEKKAKELEARGWVELIGAVEFVQPALSTEEEK